MKKKIIYNKKVQKILAEPIQWIEWLSVPHRESESRKQLMDLNKLAIPYLKKGLSHSNDQVRVGCCRVLDHLYDESCLLDLMKNLHHPNPKVRMWAVHALACERCKSCECRPEEHKILPNVIKILLSDSERHVRQMAAGMLGPSVHRSKKVKEALQKARKEDPHPVVKKICSWWLPGGTRFKKTLPQKT